MGKRRMGSLVLAASLAVSNPATTWGQDGAAGAALMRDVHALDAAKLLAAPVRSSGGTSAVFDGDAGYASASTAWRVALGGVTARVSLRGGAASGGRVAVATVLVGDRQVAEVVGAESGFDEPPYVIQIADLDAANPYPEVVFSTYTGGAHCCSETRIVTSSPDGRRWRVVEAGAFDGEPVRAEDADGDGRFELVLPDDRFAYAFACYACSSLPLRVLGLDASAISDIGAEPRYRPAHVAWLRSMITYAGESVDRNGFLAGYVAEKIRLGEGAEAWSLMLKHYDRASEWGLEQCLSARDSQGECRGPSAKLSFPEALRRFLSEIGYEPPL